MRTGNDSDQRRAWSRTVILAVAAAAIAGLIGTAAYGGSPRKKAVAADPFDGEPEKSSIEPSAKSKPFEKIDIELFNKLDTNRDGNVSQEEFKAGLTELREAMDSAPFGAGTVAKADVPRGDFVGVAVGGGEKKRPVAHRQKEPVARPKVERLKAAKAAPDLEKQRPAAAQIIRFLDPPPAAADKAPHQDLTEGAYQELLSRKVEVDVQQIPLGDFVLKLAKVTGRPVRFDEKALDELGIGSDTPVSLKATGITLRSALKRMMHQIEPQMALLLSDGSIRFTTREEAQKEPLLRVYQVGDLLRRDPVVARHGFRDAGQAADSAQQESEALVELIKNIVNPAIWKDNGGESEIKGAGGETILVSAPFELHDDVRELLAALRAVRALQRPKQAGELRPILAGDKATRESTERLTRALQQRVTLNCKEKPLQEIIAELSKMTKTPLALDLLALEEQGAGSDMLFTTSVKDVPLRSVLRALQQQNELKLAWNLQHETLSITTREHTQENLICVVYPVLDLLQPGGEEKRGISADALIEAIKGTASSESWKDNGGEGDARFFSNCGALVVSQNVEVQGQVENILTQLRKARAALPAAERAPGKAKPGKPGGKADQAAAEKPDAQDEIQLVIYHLSPATLRLEKRAKDNQGEKKEEDTFVSEAEIKEIKTLILEQTGEDQWPAATTSIHRVGNNLVIRQRASLHVKIQDLLNELDALEGDPTLQGLPPGFGGGIPPIVGQAGGMPSRGTSAGGGALAPRGDRLGGGFGGGGFGGQSSAGGGVEGRAGRRRF